ncbi:MAG: hypothetical protein AAF471_09325, partial [Myxococcota bacterium]
SPLKSKNYVMDTLGMSDMGEKRGARIRLWAGLERATSRISDEGESGWRKVWTRRACGWETGGWDGSLGVG